MLDYDLATLYAVETRALKQAVRRNIDEMDPRKINGMFDDDGYEIRRDTIKMQPLCLTCIKNNSDDWEDDILCNLNRSDQTNGKEFRCGAYEKY